MIVVECVHAFLLNIYLFKQMGAAFTDDHKIYGQKKSQLKKFSLMHGLVDDFSGNLTKYWISANT